MFGIARERMTKRILIFVPIALLAVVALVGWCIHTVWGFGASGSPRVVARAVAPDGTELCVVQEANHDITEPFTTSVVYRKPGGDWGWFYYDHQDTYWGYGMTKIDLDAKRISIFRDAKRTVTFDWETDIYRIWDGQRVTRIFTNAQTWLPASWTVTNSIRGLP